MTRVCAAVALGALVAACQPRPLKVHALKAGRDFAVGNAAAASMANFVYLLEDPTRHECALVDPAWDIDGLIAAAAHLKCRIVMAIATHGHADHVGGRLGEVEIEGVARLVVRTKVPVWIHALDADRLKATGVPAEAIRLAEDGRGVKVGRYNEVAFHHTPGHTQGSMVLEIRGAFLTGDTLFVGSVGRTDLPGGDAEALRQSLSRLLRLRPPAMWRDLVVYPGHDYGPTPTSTLEAEARSNPWMR